MKEEYPLRLTIRAEGREGKLFDKALLEYHMRNILSEGLDYTIKKGKPKDKFVVFIIDKKTDEISP